MKNTSAVVEARARLCVCLCEIHFVCVGVCVFVLVCVCVIGGVCVCQIVCLLVCVCIYA